MTGGSALARSAEPPGVAPEWRAVMEPVARQVARLHLHRPGIRPERLSGIHNPWGPAAGLVHAWALLGICEAEPIVAKVAEILGEDIVLWDSELRLRAATYAALVADGREGRYWPVDPLAGAVALCPISGGQPIVCPVPGVGAADLAGFDPDEPLNVIRYMSARSRYRRDAEFAPNRIAAEEQVLINFRTRPLWLVRGEDRAGNDFVTGFAPAVPRWAGQSLQKG